jgi:hypothetical protein
MAYETENTLAAAVKDLLYMSESDEPFEVVQWQGGREHFDAAQVLKCTGREASTPIQVLGLEDFFKGLTREQPWHGEAEKADAARYRNLLATLQQHLAETKVFRIGRIQVDIIIIGRTTTGKWAGLKTKAIET